MVCKVFVTNIIVRRVERNDTRRTIYLIPFLKIKCHYDDIVTFSSSFNIECPRRNELRDYKRGFY